MSMQETSKQRQEREQLEGRFGKPKAEPSFFDKLRGRIKSAITPAPAKKIADTLRDANEKRRR